MKEKNVDRIDENAQAREEERIRREREAIAEMASLPPEKSGEAEDEKDE